MYCCNYCQSSKWNQWNDGLLRPDVNEYLHQTYFEFDYTTGQIQPNSVATAEDQNRAEVTIRYLDHSERRRFRKLELRKWQLVHDMPIDDFAYRDYLENE